MKGVRVADIVATAAEVTGISADEITGKCRKQSIMGVRFACYMLGARAGHSTPAIGKLFGRDHSTIIHGRDDCKRRMRRDPLYRRLVAHIACEAMKRAPLTRAHEARVYTGLIFARQRTPYAAPLLASPIAPQPVDLDAIDDVDLLSMAVAQHYGRVSA